MRYRGEDQGFEKPDYEVQHRRGTIPTRPSAIPARDVSGPLSARRFVETDERADFDEYPDDRE